MERVCLHCGNMIRVGRTDKKFCDVGCKDTYYNAIKSKEHVEIGNIDRILKRNRRILKRFLELADGQKLFSREQLVRRGFEFDYHTHIVAYPDEKTEIKFCYDYGYRQAGIATYEVFKSSLSNQK